MLVLIRWIQVCEWRIRDNLDIVFVVPIDELLLLEERMCLELMRVRTDGADVEDLVELTRGEVRDADVAGRPGCWVCWVRRDQFLHGPPGVEDRGVLVDDSAAILLIG